MGPKIFVQKISYMIIIRSYIMHFVYMFGENRRNNEKTGFYLVSKEMSKNEKKWPVSPSFCQFLRNISTKCIIYDLIIIVWAIFKKKKLVPWDTLGVPRADISGGPRSRTMLISNPIHFGSEWIPCAIGGPWNRQKSKAGWSLVWYENHKMPRSAWEELWRNIIISW